MMTRKNQHKSLKGFTLIELLVTIVLFVIVLGIIYAMLNFAHMQVSLSSQRTASQAELRQIMELIKKQVTTASGVAVVTENTGSGSDIICYVKQENKNEKTMGTLMLYREDSAPAAGMGCFPVEGLNIAFSVDSGRNQVLHVKITAADGLLLESDIYGENLPVSGITGTSGNAIICIPIT
jgi:prepilin-type N-terminal cleavage/methylation domain-containing protein